MSYNYANDKATPPFSWEPAGTTSGTASLYGATQPPHADSDTANMAQWCWSHEQNIFTQNAPAGCENIYASSNNNDNYDCEILNLYEPQMDLTIQLGHQLKDMVEGDAPTWYYLDDALACECDKSQPIRDDMLSDFYPEAWELSPKDTYGIHI